MSIAAFEEKTRHLNLKNLLLGKEDRIIYEQHRDEDCLRNGYSATKSFTAAAFGIAWEKGLVSEEEYVKDCFANEMPEHPSPYLKQLQVKHLLSLTIGQKEAWLMGASRPLMTEKDWVRFSLRQEFIAQPGTEFKYTNVGPYLAGILVAKRAGMSLSAFLYENLLAPLGINYPTMEKDPLARDFGAGGMMMTTRHLYAFGSVFLHDGMGLVSPEWVRLVQKESFPKSHYGYGFWLPGDDIYMADGKYGQYSVIMPKKKAVLAATMDDPNPNRLIDAFMEEIYPEI